MIDKFTMAQTGILAAIFGIATNQVGRNVGLTEGQLKRLVAVLEGGVGRKQADAQPFKTKRRG